MIRAVWRWWRDEWDFWLIWACVLSIALAAGGIFSATAEAVQHATSYR